jgi:hypothetical protein
MSSASRSSPAAGARPPSASYRCGRPSRPGPSELCRDASSEGHEDRLRGDVASGLGVARAGFAYRVRALVYLRNRCAHHSRLWNHSVIDAGPTPNNVRAKAKRLAGQFTPRSVVDVIASLDDILLRGADAAPILPELVAEHSLHDVFWRGLTTPRTPLDHRGPQWERRVRDGPARPAPRRMPQRIGRCPPAQEAPTGRSAPPDYAGATPGSRAL